MLLKEAALYSIEDEAGDEGAEVLEPGGHIGGLLAAVDAVVEQLGEEGQ